MGAHFIFIDDPTRQLIVVAFVAFLILDDIVHVEEGEASGFCEFFGVGGFALKELALALCSLFPEVAGERDGPTPGVPVMMMLGSVRAIVMVFLLESGLQSGGFGETKLLAAQMRWMRLKAGQKVGLGACRAEQIAGEIQTPSHPKQQPPTYPTIQKKAPIQTIITPKAQSPAKPSSTRSQSHSHS